MWLMNYSLSGHRQLQFSLVGAVWRYDDEALDAIEDIAIPVCACRVYIVVTAAGLVDAWRDQEVGYP